MEAFIIELLEKYKYKKYDDNFIKEFIDFAIKNYNLEDYVEKSEVKMFNELGECYIAVYYYLEKSITIYRDRLDDFMNSRRLRDESNFYKNAYLAQILLHELEHAIQNKMIYESDTMEAQILKYSMIRDERDYVNKYNDSNFLKYLNPQYIYNLRRVVKKNKNYYNPSLYILAPEERLAQYKSYKTLLNAIQKIRGYDKDKRVFKDNSEKSAYNAYLGLKGDYPSPTIKYLKSLGYLDKLREFDWFDEDHRKCFDLSINNYSYEERLSMGLPLSINEIDKNFYKKI